MIRAIQNPKNLKINPKSENSSAFFLIRYNYPEVKGENVSLSNSSMRVQAGGSALLNRFHTVNLDRCFLSAL